MNYLKKEYFSPAELAKLHGISKSLLLYYDREKIFSPSIVDERGYRFYSLRQCFELKILTDLRKLDIPLPDLAHYIQNKSASSLEKLLATRLITIQETVDTLRQQAIVLQRLRKRMQEIRHTVPETIKLCYLPEEYLQFSPEATAKDGRKNWLSIFLQHDKKYHQCISDIDPYFGAYLSKKQFDEKEYSTALILYQQLPKKHKDSTIKTAGQYLQLIKTGAKKQATMQAISELNIYLQKHHLVSDSGLYIMPIQNYWTTEHINQYIFCFELKVKILQGENTL